MLDTTLEREAVALFEASLEQPESARAGWLDAATSGRPELRARVDALIEADRLAALRTGAAAEALEEEQPPQRIGAYRIVERIGRGGMGSVYRGERDAGDFTHVAAIKIIKPGLLSEALVERFQRERQLLARLSHPHIARLYDGGETAAGSPYIVMEHVEGLPLLRWVEERRPPRSERLRLFAEICGAVAFAHRNLIVHRDLTPSNVLVTEEGSAKLIDFGIARPPDLKPEPEDAAASIASLSLTPGYAAPERMRSGHVTTAADIYSLGRLLDKLMLEAPGDRELESVIAKATARDPGARYDTAEALKDDVEAWHRGLPVCAYRRGKRYAARKFVGRHRMAVAAASTALLLLLGAFTLTLVAWSQAEASRRAEAARFRELRSLANYMVFDLQGMLERVVGNAGARAALANRAQSYLSTLAASREADDGLKLEAARGLTALARVQGVPTQPNLGQNERAKANLEQAVRLLRSLRQPAALTAPPLAEALAARSLVQAHVDAEPKAAGQTLKQAAALLGSVPAAERRGDWHSARRRLRKSQIELAVLEQETDELLRLTRLLEAEIPEWPPAMRSSREADLDRAFAAHYRGYYGYFTDQLDSGLAALLDAERRLVRLERARPNDPVVLYTLMWNAYVGYGVASGLPDRASEARRQVDLAGTIADRLMEIEPDDTAIKSFAGNLRQMRSQALSAEGRHREAVALQQEVIGLYEGALGPARRAAPLNRLAVAHVTLGNIAAGAGDRTRACRGYGDAQRTIAELVRRREILGFVEAHRDGLARNLERCGRGAGGGDLEILS